MFRRPPEPPKRRQLRPKGMPGRRPGQCCTSRIGRKLVMAQIGLDLMRPARGRPDSNRNALGPDPGTERRRPGALIQRGGRDPGLGQPRDLRPGAYHGSDMREGPARPAHRRATMAAAGRRDVNADRISPWSVWRDRNARRLRGRTVIDRKRRQRQQREAVRREAQGRGVGQNGTRGKQRARKCPWARHRASDRSASQQQGTKAWSSARRAGCSGQLVFGSSYCRAAAARPAPRLRIASGSPPAAARHIRGAYALVPARAASPTPHGCAQYVGLPGAGRKATLTLVGESTPWPNAAAPG